MQKRVFCPRKHIAPSAIAGLAANFWSARVLVVRTSTFHATCSLLCHCGGASPRATPVSLGLRQRGQKSGASTTAAAVVISIVTTISVISMRMRCLLASPLRIISVTRSPSAGLSTIVVPEILLQAGKRGITSNERTLGPAWAKFRPAPEDNAQMRGFCGPED
jgi:hypothetical protein